MTSLRQIWPSISLALILWLNPELRTNGLMRIISSAQGIPSNPYWTAAMYTTSGLVWFVAVRLILYVMVSETTLPTNWRERGAAGLRNAYKIQLMALALSSLLIFITVFGMPVSTAGWVGAILSFCAGPAIAEFKLRILRASYVRQETRVEAVRRDDFEKVQKLLQAGVQLDAADPGDDARPLHYAIHAQPAIMSALIASGADVNSKCRGGRTALHTAAACGKVNIAQLLIERGADLNARDDDGKTPLACTLEPTFYEKFMAPHGGGPPRQSDLEEKANKLRVGELLRVHKAEM